jgi:hypothetical protein
MDQRGRSVCHRTYVSPGDFVTTQEENVARRRRNNRNVLIIVGVVVGIFVLCVGIGAVFGEDQADESAPATTSQAPAPAPATAPQPEPAAPPATAAPSSATAAPAPAASCYPASPIKDPELAAFAAGLTLPPGAYVVSGRVSTQSDHPGEVGVALDLCVPSQSTADELRPVASEIARALRPTPLGDKTFVLYVSDIVDGNEPAKIKDPDFPMHAWNGNPSAAAENARWEVVQG